jgi:hypothetical protein
MSRPLGHAAIIVLLALVFVAPGLAHKPVTSPYSYNDDVAPILRERCGRCHVSGGIAPMSLLSHADAVPWGESIRTEVLAAHMPPGVVDEAPSRFRNAPGLSPREMNVLLTWVTGGTPAGSAANAPATATAARAWPLGAPDLALPLPSETVVPANTREQTSEFVVHTGVSERRWVRAVDLLPGNASMVRAATIAVRPPASGSSGAMLERTLALWLPGENPFPLDGGLGFELPPSADLVVRVLYRKTWEYERQALRDRSTIGIYFSRAPASPVTAVNLTSGAPTVASANRVVFRRTMTEDVRAIALYPTAGINGAAVKAVARRPNGTRVDLIAFHPRQDWVHRYWFREPIRLPRGTVIDVTATRDDEAALLPLSLAPPTASRPKLSSLQLTLNVVH